MSLSLRGRGSIALSGSGGGGGSSPVLEPAAAALGLAMQSMSILIATSPATISAGLLTMDLCYFPGGVPISQLCTVIQTEGVTASGRNGMALYDTAGNRIDVTGDMSAQFATVGYAAGNLAGGPETPAAGPVYVCTLSHFSGSSPKLYATNGSVPIPVVHSLGTSIYFTGQTDFPATLDLSTANINTGGYYVGAL